MCPPGERMRVCHDATSQGLLLLLPVLLTVGRCLLALLACCVSLSPDADDLLLAGILPVLTVCVACRSASTDQAKCSIYTSYDLVGAGFFGSWFGHLVLPRFKQYPYQVHKLQVLRRRYVCLFPEPLRPPRWLVSAGNTLEQRGN